MNRRDRPFLIADYCASNPVRFNIPYLTTYFSARNDELVEFHPSKWKKELSKTTEEIFDQISKSVNNRFLAPEFRVPDDIIVRPPLLVFRNCSSNASTNKLSFTITNRSKHALDLCCEPPRSEVFQVQTDQISLRRLSPHQSVIVSVKYTPPSEEDHLYVIKFTSKKGSFNIPVLGIGPRFLVACSDSVLIDEAYINMTFSTLLLLSNHGPQQLDLILLTEPPFKIEPSKMILEPYCSGNVKVTIKATNSGKQVGKLKIKHGTGEEVIVDLIGIVVVGDITLDKNIVTFPGVYMNTQAKETVILQSNVTHPVSFSWRRYKTEAEDKAQLDKLQEMLGTIYSTTDTRPFLNFKPDILSENIMNKEKQLTDSYNCFLFDNPFFTIEPMFGSILPMSTFECSVFFHPEQIVPHKVKAYLHIECRVERAELEVEGLVLGPRIDTSISMVDMNVCGYLSRRGIEITFINNGPIEGTVKYLHEHKSFIVCEPMSLHLKATTSKIMILLIDFIYKGPFLTELKFLIEESGEVLNVFLKGTVVGSPIRTDCEMLDFGNVSLGFTISETFNFYNDGDTPMEYNLVIANDGYQEPLRISQFLKTIRAKFPPFPKEFSITPCKGIIEGKSRIPVEVEFTANRYYERFTEISLLLNDVVVQDFRIPIKYYCHHPMITCEPFEFNLKYLVLEAPSEIEFTMSNDGSAPAAFVISMIGSSVRAKFSKTNGILESGRSIPIKATLTPIKLGTGTAVIGVDLFGRTVIEEAVWVYYKCSAPKLCLNPSKLKWHITEDNCTEDLTKEVIISNPFQTPISCRVKMDPSYAHMWQVTPRKATIETNQVVSVKPIIIDFGKSTFTFSVEYDYQNEMKFIVNSKITTAIRSVPSIFEGYDFGNVLKNELYSKSVKFVNIGLKTYTVMSKPREKDIYTNPFAIKPRSFSIKSKEKVDVSLEFRHDTFGAHQSTFDVFIFDKLMIKCPIGTCLLTANVVSKRTALSCEPDVLELFITSKYVKDVQGSVKVSTSVSCLDELECVIDHPYFFVIDDQNVVTKRVTFQISPTVSKTVVILFKPDSGVGRQESFQTCMDIRVNSVGIKKKVEIWGKVNLPHFTWSQQNLDFGCLYPFQDGHEEITIANGTFETLSFDCQYISILKTRPIQSNEEGEDEEESEWRSPTGSTLAPPSPTSLSEGEHTMTDQSRHEKEKQETPKSDRPTAVRRKSKKSTTSQSRKSETKKASSKKNSRKSKKTIKAASKENIEQNIDIVSIPYDECVARAQKEITDTLIPILNNTIDPSIGVQETRRNLRSPVPLDQFNEFFLISPMSGEVLPGESVTFSVAYLPREPSVTVEAEISVYRDDDYEETLKLKGVCRESFQYEITPLNVDFGIIPFCEISSCEIFITNLTECRMEIEVLNIVEEDTKDTRFQRLGTICVKPSVCTVNAYSTEILTAMVHPFILTKFFKKYRIKIHGVQDEILTLQGESSLHFLNLEVPPLLEKVPIIDQYNGLKIMYNRLYRVEPKLDKSPSDICLQCPDDDFDWEIVSEKEIPRITDLNDGILMGMAEKFSEKYCEEYYQHAIKNNGTDPLPYLVLPKQVFDIGGTILEEQNFKILRVSNNSDFDVRYSLSINRSKAELRAMGLKIEGLDQENHFLQKGKVNEYNLLFHPRNNHYNLKKKLHIKMGWLLTIKVACGPTMRVHIKTIVTKPTISVPSSIDFGHVRCNEKLLLKFKIVNENITSCEWSAEMKRSFYETLKRKILRVGVPNPFAIEGPDMNGILGPMLEYELLISFEPPSAGEFLGELVINVDNKRFSFIAELKGFGECPNIEFTPPKIEFEGIVPHNGFSEKVLIIRNNGVSPVDIYLPECREYFMEQFMLRSVLNYMQTDVCYVPACSEDDTPMSYLHEMFSILVQKAEEHFRERGISTTDEYVFVNDYLQLLDDEESVITRYDLASIVCARAEERRKEREGGNGRLIVCTGAPTVDYIQEANLMATAMHLNVASLDQLFFEEIASSNKEVAAEIRVSIDNEFHKIMEDDFSITPELAGNDHYKPIIWRMKFEAISKWADWMGKKSPSNVKPLRAETTEHINTPETTAKPTKAKSKSKPASKDKEENDKLDDPLRIHPYNIQKLLQDRFQDLIHGNGLIIDSLSSVVLKDPMSVLSLLIRMTTERDRVDYVDMFTTLEKATTRYKLQEELEKQKQERLKPRFSQICLYEDATFNALDKPIVDAFFKELKKRYIFCHGAQEVDELPQDQKPKTAKKRKSKASKSKKSRAVSNSEGHKRSSKQSFRSLRSRGSADVEVNEKSLEKMKLMSDFLEYETRRVEINNFLLGKRTSSKSHTDSTDIVHVNMWVINSEPFEVQSRIHELLETMIECEEFKMPEKLQVEHSQKTSRYQQRYFRLDRPKFINEIDGEIDGLWFPSLTHTFGVYSSEQHNPFCIYPIDPGSIFCGISRLGFRRSNWWPDEQTVSQFHLEPGEKVSALVVFQPKETGIFEKTLRVNIAGWPGQAAGVVIEGVSDIPHIDLDLQTIFPPNCYAFEELPVRPSLEIVQQTILEMGPALVARTKRNKKFKVQSNLTFKNISRVTCKILFSLKSPSAIFELEIEEATVEPNKSVVLNIYAFPRDKGFRSCLVVVSIEENPIPIFIEARVEGYKLNVTLSPPVVTIQDVLVTLTKKAHFNIKNDTWVPIQWKLSEKQVREHVYLNFKTKFGVLKSQESISSLVSYTPQKVHDVEVDVDVMIRQHSDDKSKFEKGATLKLHVSSRDVIVDIQTESFNGLLVYEEAYVDTKQTKSFIVANLGPFPVKFKVTLNNTAGFNPHKIFKINHYEGILQRRRDVKIEVTANSSKPVAFKSLPLLMVEIWDEIENKLITSLTVNITYAVFHPAYEIRPLEDFTFGNLMVGETRFIDLAIENKGSLPLDFKILNELAPVEPPPEEPGSRRVKKRRKTKRADKSPSVILEPEKLPRIKVAGVHANKTKNRPHHKKGHRGSKKVRTKRGNKKKPKSAPTEVLKKEESLKRAATVVSEGVVTKVRPRLLHTNRSYLKRSLRRACTASKKSPSVPSTVGDPNVSKVVAEPFVIEYSTNNLSPKETAHLKLIFNPQQEGEFKQRFFVSVLHSKVEDQSIEVSGNGVLPSISHTVIEVLRDAFVNLSPENERKQIAKGFPCKTYHEETHLLELCNYIVGEKVPINIYLLNNGPVTALVQVYVTGDDTGSFSFAGDLKVIDVSIPIKTTKPIELFFTPKSTEIIEVMGHIELKMPKGVENRHYIVKMKARGHIPQLDIIRPDDYDPTENKYCMDMGIAILNRSSEDYFTIKNIGSVVARVMVEFPVTPGVFTFRAKGNYRELLKHPSNNPLIDPFTISMTPDMEIDIAVEYTAASKISDSCTVFIHVIGNPYEKLVLEIYGKGIIKELNMDLPSGRVVDVDAKHHRRKAMSTVHVDTLHGGPRLSKERFFYELDFGCVALKEFVKKTFVVNNSSYFTIRVIFPQSTNVWFIPHTFHIGPNSLKEVIALFRSEQDIIYNEIHDTTFDTIAYFDRRADVWENNPKLFEKLMNKEGNEIKEEDLREPELPEPQFETQSGKIMDNKHLTIAVYGRAGSPNLKIMTPSIQFPPTRTFEESIAVLFVKNVGNLGGNCFFELGDPFYETWGDMAIPECSIGLDFDNPPQLLEPEPTQFNGLHRSGGLSSSKPAKPGYLYAPAPVILKDVSNSHMKGSRSAESIPESNNYNPFQVEPSTLFVPPGEVRYVKVSFKPKENWTTLCSLILRFIEDEVNRQVSCTLEGTPLYCPCHIVCEPGKPLIEQFREEGLKVIDIRATSPKDDAEKRFDLLNVSNKTFEFTFKNLDQEDNKILYCNPPKGRIESSTKKEITLHFHPSTFGEFKSLWALNIPDFDIKQNILFVGRVASPIVRIVPPATTVPVTLTGIFRTESMEIVNDDEIDFGFSLRQLPQLIGIVECDITPNKGIVRAGASVPFKVRFTSENSGNLTIQIGCRLKNHEGEIVAMIFAEFFELQCMLSLQYDQDQKRKLDPSQTNDINIGFVEPNHPQSATFILANFGQGPLRYRWHVHDTQIEKTGIRINFNRNAGVLERQSTQALQTIFTITKNIEFKNYIVQLQVYRGPTYTLSFSGHSELPYKFSFKIFNFGSCPVLRSDVCNYIKTLQFTNESDQPIVLENKFSNKPHLRVLWSCGTVHPKETISIMVEFYPVSQSFYQEDVEFNINGVISETVTFIGKGLVIAVRLRDLDKDTIDLKKVPVGSTRTEVKKVVNYSPLAVGCELEVERHEGLLITPLSFLIKKNGFQDVTVSYSPKSKTEPFTSEVFIYAGGMRHFLFVVKCSTSHISVKLDNNVLLFGRAIKYCPVQFSVNIINDGDIGVNYCWDLEKLKTLLSVTPERGYLAPNSTLQSSFSLLSLNKVTINQKVVLIYNGKQTEELKIVGEFIEIPDPSETINFKTLVRSSVEHTVELESRSAEPVILFPVLIGDYFSSPDFVEVLPQTKSRYTVTYAPLAMTSTTVHSGRLFVPYPDGTCVYYALIGEAQPPEQEEIIEWTIVSKTSLTKTFEVNNWLNEFQRLSANVSLDNPDKIKPGIVSIMGEPAVCLSPNGSALYPVDVIVCRAMNFSFRIFFVNPDSKEYRYYIVKVKSLPPPEAPVLEIQARVHDSTSTAVKLSNPFVEPVTFKFHSPVPELTANDVTIGPRSEAELIVKYAPSAVEPPYSVACRVTGQPLDDESMTFFLVPQFSTTPEPISVSATMGSSEDFSINVYNPAKHKVIYAVQIYDEDLSVLNENEFEIPAQKHYTVALNYEPSAIGNKELYVELQSTINEVFKYYINATSHPPKPMGPINIELGSYEIIQFKNVLNEAATFSLTMSEYIFAVTIKIEEKDLPLPGVFTLESKETALISVELRETDVKEHRFINSFPIAEKMEISLMKRGNYMLDEKDLICWVYYLKGLLPQEANKTDGTSPGSSESVSSIH